MAPGYFHNIINTPRLLDLGVFFCARVLQLGIIFSLTFREHYQGNQANIYIVDLEHLILYN